MVKIPLKMEEAPPPKLLTLLSLFTQFTLVTLGTLFTLFALLTLLSLLSLLKHCARNGILHILFCRERSADMAIWLYELWSKMWDGDECVDTPQTVTSTSALAVLR